MLPPRPHTLHTGHVLLAGVLCVHCTTTTITQFVIYGLCQVRGTVVMQSNIYSGRKCVNQDEYLSTTRPIDATTYIPGLLLLSIYSTWITATSLLSHQWFSCDLVSSLIIHTGSRDWYWDRTERGTFFGYQRGYYYYYFVVWENADPPQRLPGEWITGGDRIETGTRKWTRVPLITSDN